MELTKEMVKNGVVEMTTIGEEFTDFKSDTIMIPKYVEVDGTMEKVDKIGDYAFESKEFKYLAIFDNIVEIGEHAFDGCSVEVVYILGENLRVIKNHAFWCCHYLDLIILPNSVEYIGEFAFSECNMLKQFRIPEKVSTIKEDTFSFCANLESIDFQVKSNVSVIEACAFFKCESLYYMHFPESVKKIGEYAFAECTNLEVVKIKNFDEIGTMAFSNCKSLGNLYYHGLHGKIDPSAFYGCSMNVHSL